MLLSNVFLQFSSIIDPLRCSLHQLSNIIPSLTLRSKIFSSIFYYHWCYALGYLFHFQHSTIILLGSKIFPKIFPSTFQHCTIIGAILQDLLFNFLPFYHRWCYAPRSSPRYGRHGWHMVCHMVSWGTIKSYLSNLQTWKTTPFQQNHFFSRCQLCHVFLPARSRLQPLTATRVAASGRKWPQVAAFGQINFHPQRSQSTPLNLTIDHGIEFSKWGQYGSTINTGWTHTICLRANDFDTQIMEGLSWCNSSSVGSTHGIK